MTADWVCSEFTIIIRNQEPGNEIKFRVVIKYGCHMLVSWDIYYCVHEENKTFWSSRIQNDFQCRKTQNQWKVSTIVSNDTVYWLAGLICLQRVLRSRYISFSFQCYYRLLNTTTVWAKLKHFAYCLRTN